jgi:hypothetical protein
VDPRAGLEDVEKRKFLTSDPSVVQPVARRYTDYLVNHSLHDFMFVIIARDEIFGKD